MIVLKWHRQILRQYQMPQVVIRCVEFCNSTLHQSIRPTVVFNFAPNTYRRKCEVWEGAIYIYLDSLTSDGHLDLGEVLVSTVSMFGIVCRTIYHPEATSISQYDPTTKTLTIRPGWTLAQKRAYVEQYVSTVFRLLGWEDFSCDEMIDAAEQLWLVYQQIREERTNNAGKY